LASVAVGLMQSVLGTSESQCVWAPYVARDIPESVVVREVESQYRVSQ
jgi:hypothetical protein